MIVPILISYEEEYVNDAYASVLTQAFETLQKKYLDATLTNAKFVADRFVNNVNNTNKTRFYKAIENAVGVNLQSIIQNEELEDILVASISENVNLIKSIPDEYLKNVESIVFTGTTQGNQPRSMIQQLRDNGVKSNNRAKMIARDQTSKVNSALNQQRQQNLGIEEYIWQTSGDERVRDSHKRKNGKTFRWDDPPKDTGHPGQDIQCRCVAKPIINL